MKGLLLLFSLSYSVNAPANCYEGKVFIDPIVGSSKPELADTAIFLIINSSVHYYVYISEVQGNFDSLFKGVLTAKIIHANVEACVDKNIILSAFARVIKIVIN